MNFQHTADCQGTPESPCECIAGVTAIYFPAAITQETLDASEAKGGKEFIKVTLVETKVFEDAVIDNINKALMEAFVGESLVDIGRKQVADLMAYRLQDMMKALETTPYWMASAYMAGMATGVGASPTWRPCPPAQPSCDNPPCDGRGYLCDVHIWPRGQPPFGVPGDEPNRKEAAVPEVILDIYDGRAK